MMSNVIKGVICTNLLPIDFQMRCSKCDPKINIYEILCKMYRNWANLKNNNNNNNKKKKRKKKLKT